jgi:hypothetical protein
VDSATAYESLPASSKRRIIVLTAFRVSPAARLIARRMLEYDNHDQNGLTERGRAITQRTDTSGVQRGLEHSPAETWRLIPRFQIGATACLVQPWPKTASAQRERARTRQPSDGQIESTYPACAFLVSCDLFALLTFVFFLSSLLSSVCFCPLVEPTAILSVQVACTSPALHLRYSAFFYSQITDLIPTRLFCHQQPLWKSADSGPPLEADPIILL